MHTYTQHVSPVLLGLLVKECNFIFLKIVHIMKMLSYYVVSPASPNQKKKKKSKKNFICLVETSERNRYMADVNQQLDGRLASRIPTRMKNA